MPADPTETVAEHRARLQPSINLHAPVTAFMFSCSGTQCTTPEGWRLGVSPVQWSKPHSILASTQDSNPGGRIQNHKRWPLHYHFVPFKSTIKNLGVIIDSNLSFDQHIDATCKSAHFHIRALRHIRGLLSTEVARCVAASIVGSRLDYCNGLLFGATSKNLCKLQLVQNTAARVVVMGRNLLVSMITSDLSWKACIGCLLRRESR